MENLEQFPRYKNADMYVSKSQEMLRRTPSFKEIDHKFYIVACELRCILEKTATPLRRKFIVAKKKMDEKHKEKTWLGYRVNNYIKKIYLKHKDRI